VIVIKEGKMEENIEDNKMSLANLAYRVGQLEEKYKKIDNKLDEIRTNHLPHIEQELISLKSQVKLMVGSIGITIVLQLILKFLI